MAFSFGFYNSIEHDRKYDAVQMSMIFDGIILDGVYATIGKAFVLRTNSQGRVIVQPGRAWFNHTWNYNDADLPLDTPESDLVFPRYDAVVIDIQGDVFNRVNDIIWVQGVASANPQKPTMIHELEHNQYPLGYIYRRANTDIIDQEDIENTVGTSECPFVTGILEVISIDELLLQWKAQWSNFMARYDAEAREWYEEFKIQLNEFKDAYQEDFLLWFNNLRVVLDGDVAGHLQNEIDHIGRREFNHYYGLDTIITSIDKSQTIIIENETIQIEDEDSEGEEEDNTIELPLTLITAESNEDVRTTKIYKLDDVTHIEEEIIPNDGNMRYIKKTIIEKINGKTKITESFEQFGKRR